MYIYSIFMNVLDGKSKLPIADNKIVLLDEDSSTKLEFYILMEVKELYKYKK